MTKIVTVNNPYQSFLLTDSTDIVLVVCSDGRYEPFELEIKDILDIAESCDPNASITRDAYKVKKIQARELISVITGLIIPPGEKWLLVITMTKHHITKTYIFGLTEVISHYLNV